jgi:RNA polymerase sigma-70 factor, ECF subfamily
VEPESEQLRIEIELLQRTGQGDRHSFAQLYDRFSGVLFSTAYRVLNDQHAAEDVLQDVFVQIWDKAPLYDSARGKPLTWAVTLTRNKAIDRLRSVQRRTRAQDELERQTSIFTKWEGKTSADEVDASEKSRMVRSAVMQLSDEQRQAIEMAFFSGMTQAEIAEKLEEPLGTVKARIRRGMMKLKDLITGDL